MLLICYFVSYFSNVGVKWKNMLFKTEHSWKRFDLIFLIYLTWIVKHVFIWGISVIQGDAPFIHNICSVRFQLLL